MLRARRPQRSPRIRRERHRNFAEVYARLLAQEWSADDAACEAVWQSFKAPFSLPAALRKARTLLENREIAADVAARLAASKRGRA